jgi:nicotinamidase-related amidase
MRPVFGLLSAGLLVSFAFTQENAPLKVTLRSRAGDGYQVVTKAEAWNPKETAIIVCDMWDRHHCPTSEKRVVELAPRMNEVLKSARGRGVFIINAPSSCMDPYKDHPARLLAKNAPKAADLPKDIGVWCYKIPSEDKGKYPIDQSDGACDCADKLILAHEEAMAKEGRNPKAPWKAQNERLTIADNDAISDSGVEIWNLLTQRGIKNVMLMGVHTNMCVLGRPFGLRQMAKNGKNVVLVRDLTDTMYNPERWPNVSHFKGTELIVEHIEKFVSPTITSDQIAGGEPFRFKGQGN